MKDSLVKECQAVLQKNFEVESAKLTKLEGYDSVNYKIESDKGLFVLKRYDYSKENIELLHAENEIIKSLSVVKKQDFPSVFPSTDNQSLIIEGEYIYRLLGYVQGDFLGDVEHTSALLRSLGSFLGNMDMVIYQSYLSAIQAKETQWDLQYFKSNYQYLNYISDAKDRNLVDYFFLQFDEQVYPIQEQLRKGVIHNDGNDWNVLTKDGRVSGIIDFGDMCHSWIINEVAVAITYVMMGKKNPLEAASQVIEGYQEVFPIEEIELSILYYLVGARLCTSVCNSAYSKTIKPDSDYITISEKPAWKLLRTWLSINPVKAENCFRKAAGLSAKVKNDLADQLKLRKTHMSEILSLSYTRPIHMNRSAFQYMYDADSNTFLDAYNNIMLAGHCHPKVVRAGQQAMAKLNTNTRYVYDILQKYSEKLASKLPDRLNKVFLVNSGSAATDLGLRMAMHHTKKNKILALENGYHGNTQLGIEVSHYKYANRKGKGQKEFVLNTSIPKVFGSGYEDNGQAGKHFSEKAGRIIEENTGQVAAFIAEPIVGCGGQVPLAKGYLKEVYPKIRNQGGICISDEVQVGFARLGDYFWGFEMHEVIPDMVILGKPMGNGHPIGAVVTTSEIASSFESGPEFFSSFGGNPVSCAIGLAILEVIEEERLQEHAKIVGDYFISELRKLQIQFPQIANVRGQGLFLGLELLKMNGDPDTKLAFEIKNHLRENYILIGTDGPYNNVLKIKPPLSFNCNNADQVVRTLKEFLRKIPKNL